MNSHHYKLNKADGTDVDPYDHCLEDKGGYDLCLEDKGRTGSSHAILADKDASSTSQKNDADPTTYPCDVDEDTRYKIDSYLLAYPQLNILAKGSYQTKYAEKFSLKHDVHVCGSLEDVNDQSKANNWLKDLLVPEFENKIFSEGRHVLPVFGQYGLVSHYFTFTTRRKIVVRKDNYNNIVCDIVTAKPLGDGSFGEVYMVDGTIKYRYDQNEGYRREEGNRKRVVKLYKEQSKSTAEMMRELDNEIYFTRCNKSCAVRSGFFGELNRHQRSMGFSSRFIPEIELSDLINDDYTGKLSLGPLDRIKLIISILKAVRDQVHYHKIMHRDFKPENMRVQKKANHWIVNILDYGLAAYESAFPNGFKGTTAYIPVEVADNIHQNRASDIFAIGLVIALILYDKHQLIMPRLSPESVYQARDRYDWIIPLDGLFSYGLANAFSPEIRSAITKILEDMLDEDYNLRPDVDICIEQFEEIYRKIHDDKYTHEQRDAIHAAREAGRKYLSLMGEKKFVRPTREVMDQLLKNIKEATASLPSNGILFDEFIRTIDCKFAYGAANMGDFHNRMQAIVNEYFNAFDQIKAIHDDLLTLLTHLRNQPNVNCFELDGLSKTTSQLGSFLETVKANASVNLDDMQQEVTHLQNKYRKELSYQKHFHHVFEDKLMSEESASSTISNGPRNF